MTTTPEQLQAWRDRWCTLFPQWADGIGILSAASWQGYMRRCQETEQAIKDARKQALEDVAEGFIKQKSWMRDYAFAVVEHAAKEGVTK
jgi:hypothetical protein